MPEHSTTATVGSNVVGCDLINAYLDSVEQALISAGAPRTDRLQVLQDLEAQIADMLAQQPRPLTEDIVHSVIAQLEPPSHFAANYANGKELNAAETRPSRSQSRFRWPMIAAAGCASVLIGYVFLMLAAAIGAAGPAVGMIAMLLLIGIAVTPLAIWKSIKQSRAGLALPADRNLVLRTAIVYAAVVPTSLLLLACAATQGIIMIPIGMVAFVYFQYALVRRLWHRLNDTLPPQPTPGADNNNSTARSTSTPMSFSSAMSMPAI
ncbi:MAG TPA: hypothetical protein VGM76_03070 [Lacipirellulaceae bacterium]|jgi:uncharacterized Tic20 family protein